MVDERKPTIVIIEDDDVDLESVIRGLSKRQLDFHVHSFSDGRQGIDYLRQEISGVEDAPPVIIILDINMPGMNGHQFLADLRSDHHLKSTLVFVLTTSDHARDRAEAYDKNVAGYFVKSNTSALLDVLAIYAEHAELPGVS